MPPTLDAVLDGLAVDAARTQDELDALARFSSSPPPGVTRVLFTEVDLAGRGYVKSLMREAGLAVIEDAAGNIFGRWRGAAGERGRIGTGSHCDAIPDAGKYDGTVGVLGGIAAVRSLKAAGFAPRRSIDVVMFTSEEPTRFGIGCCGSRLLGGALEPQALGLLTDAEGVSFDAARQAAGCEGELADAALAPGDYAAFVELHVEQGPVLEREGLDIGVVSAIAAPASFEVTFAGDGGHAGTVLMPDRQDALVPAGHLIAQAEALARESESPDTVATVGIVEVHPGAVNSIPREVRLTLDVRDTALDVRDGIARELKSAAERLAEARGLRWRFQTLNEDPPAFADAAVMQAIEASAAAASLGHRRLVSRAYHDALFMSRVAPMGMIFVPSKGGISHRPDEYTSRQEVANGVRTLAGALAKLAGRAA